MTAATVPRNRVASASSVPRSSTPSAPPHDGGFLHEGDQEWPDVVRRRVIQRTVSGWKANRPALQASRHPVEPVEELAGSFHGDRATGQCGECRRRCREHLERMKRADHGAGVCRGLQRIELTRPAAVHDGMVRPPRHVLAHAIDRVVGHRDEDDVAEIRDCLRRACDEHPGHAVSDRAHRFAPSSVCGGDDVSREMKRFGERGPDPSRTDDANAAHRRIVVGSCQGHYGSVRQPGDQRLGEICGLPLARAYCPGVMA